MANLMNELNAAANGQQAAANTQQQQQQQQDSAAVSFTDAERIEERLSQIEARLTMTHDLLEALAQFMLKRIDGQDSETAAQAAAAQQAQPARRPPQPPPPQPTSRPEAQPGPEDVCHPRESKFGGWYCSNYNPDSPNSNSRGYCRAAVKMRKDGTYYISGKCNRGGGQ